MNQLNRRTALGASLAALCSASGLSAAAPAPSPSKAVVRVGLDAEFGLQRSTSAQAIELGMRLAIAEVNTAGGVLGGRPLELVTRDNHSMPARSQVNLRDMAELPDLVAVFGGRFSPVVIDAVPLVHELKLPFFAVWSSADPIIENGQSPNYMFRVSLRDGLAMPKMLETAHQRGVDRVGLLLANTGWGRSNLSAAQRHLVAVRRPALAQVAWFHRGERSMVQRYQSLRAAGAKAVLMVADDGEAAGLVREVAALPVDERLPLLCHQGITGGKFTELCGPALQAVDLSVLQTFSFFGASRPALVRFMKTAAEVAKISRIEDIEAPTGVAHAYDALHILARAVSRAGSTRRAAVRDALERVPEHAGLIRDYRPPFSSGRHEALGPAQLLMARYRADGVLVPVDAS